ncbi:hypothetical protein F3Y22_tig00110013pilonHSYRG00243 [Hibiscus syriacus]|uniref:Uncharacterized protein n=1 Tax=Hibiscus syriacus TaxID=106335 RepID=A0A6A3BN63_HIBSY|nr:hypothetical protein F3Y22_tig00110013pilonHSYRG00243 [Hibiscus syriacus]
MWKLSLKVTQDAEGVVVVPLELCILAVTNGLVLSERKQHLTWQLRLLRLSSEMLLNLGHLMMVLHSNEFDSRLNPSPISISFNSAREEFIYTWNVLQIRTRPYSQFFRHGNGAHSGNLSNLLHEAILIFQDRKILPYGMEVKLGQEFISSYSRQEAVDSPAPILLNEAFQEQNIVPLWNTFQQGTFKYFQLLNQGNMIVFSVAISVHSFRLCIPSKVLTQQSSFANECGWRLPSLAHCYSLYRPPPFEFAYPQLFMEFINSYELLDPISFGTQEKYCPYGSVSPHKPTSLIVCNCKVDYGLRCCSDESLEMSKYLKCFNSPREAGNFGATVVSINAILPRLATDIEMPNMRDHLW